MYRQLMLQYIWLLWLSQTSCMNAFAASQQSKNTNTNPLSSLSVTELKHLLSNRGIDFRDCLEKRDLIERLEQSKSKPARSSEQHDPWGEGFRN
jgi:hypothetical protein